MTQCPSCSTEVTYTDHIHKDVVCRGVTDPYIQLYLLDDQNQDRTLEKILKFVEAKASGKRSVFRLHYSHDVGTTRNTSPYQSHCVNATQSTYR